MKQPQPPAPMHSKTPVTDPMEALTPSTKHYPAGLRYVRTLFLRTEYRKCLSTCGDLLQTPDVRTSPIHKAFLNFYSALAYDEMGRAMHHNSIAKIPALDSAEQYYIAALQALPSSKDAELLCVSLAQKSRADSFFDSGEQTPSHDGRDSFDEASLMSSPARQSSEDLSVRSSFDSPAVATSDLDDLESHDSFSELLTPHRVLNRENSRMSLLEATPPVKRHSRHISGPYEPPVASRMQRDFSRMSLLETPPRKPMSQGLLRPIRPGSAPKRFYIPPRLEDTSQIPHKKAGKQVTEVAWNSSPRSSVILDLDTSLRGQPGRPPQVSPISRMDSAHRYSSDVSTISSISPLTPKRTRNASLSSDQDVDESLCLRFNDHMDSMRMQLETHISLVQLAKDQLRELQAERASSKVAPRFGTPLRERSGNVDGAVNRSDAMDDGEALNSSAGLPRLRSYWSFVPVDAKATEKEKRIQAGRDRKWERKTERFNPRKYQDLCERALSEL